MFVPDNPSLPQGNGQLFAEGYIDLQPAPDMDPQADYSTSDKNACGWVSVGGINATVSDQNAADVLMVNLTNSGPDFAQVDDSEPSTGGIKYYMYCPAMSAVYFAYIPVYTDAQVLQTAEYGGQTYYSIDDSRGYMYRTGWNIIDDSVYARLTNGGSLTVPEGFVYFSSVEGEHLGTPGQPQVQYTVPNVDSLSAQVGGNLNLYFMIFDLSGEESDTSMPLKLYGQYDDISDAQESIQGGAEGMVVLFVMYIRSYVYNGSLVKAATFGVQILSPVEGDGITYMIPITEGFYNLGMLFSGASSYPTGYQVEVSGLDGSGNVGLAVFESNALVDIYRSPKASNFFMRSYTGKVWARIKKFFTKAWKVVKNVVGVVVPVASKVLPPPYGTVAAGVGATVSAIDSTINAFATVSNNTTLAGAAPVTLEGDYFEITPQYHIAVTPEVLSVSPMTTSTGLLDVLDPRENSGDWVDGETYQVAVDATSAQMFSSRHDVSSNALYQQIVADWKNKVTFYPAEAERPVAYVQQRLRVRFRKALTYAQAQGYKASLVVASNTYYDHDE